MNLTISLGKELGEITNDITDVFVTKDYIGILMTQYEEHVNAFYDDEVVNEFNQIHAFQKVLETTYSSIQPFDAPLEDIGDVKDLLQEVLDNRAAYRAVMSILIGYTKKGGATGPLIRDLIETLLRDSKGFTECAMNYDRRMGTILPVSAVIRTIVAYGRLSGMVDYYNFNEGKDS